jgi:hypothetical protein
MTTKTSSPIIIEELDPFEGSNLSLTNQMLDTLHPGERPPQQWGQIDERALAGGLAIHIIGLHQGETRLATGRPNVRYLVERFREALSATYVKATTGGYGHDLRGYYAADEDLRKRWRRLDLALQSPSLRASRVIDELMRSLLAGGDLLETLIARRERIDRQICHLARVRGAS